MSVLQMHMATTWLTMNSEMSVNVYHGHSSECFSTVDVDKGVDIKLPNDQCNRGRFRKPSHTQNLIFPPKIHISALPPHTFSYIHLHSLPPFEPQPTRHLHPQPHRLLRKRRLITINHGSLPHQIRLLRPDHLCLLQHLPEDIQ